MKSLQNIGSDFRKPKIIILVSVLVFLNFSYGFQKRYLKVHMNIGQY